MLKEKLKLKMEQRVSKVHGGINMFCNMRCTKSIQDFNYQQHAQGQMINISVENNELANKLKDQKEFKNAVLHKDMDLNKNIDPKQLDEAPIDKFIAQRLLMQDDDDTELFDFKKKAQVEKTTN